MFNRIKKLAKKVVNKIKEIVKYISEKIEENIIMEEVVKLKKLELVIDTAKSAANGVVNKIRDDKNRLILGLVVLGLGVGLGGSLIASVYIPTPNN